MQEREFARLQFREAAPLWLASRTHLAEGSRHDYQRHFKRLLPFFGELRLEEIHVGHLEEYRRQRLLQIRERKLHHAEHPGASRINHEINTVQQILQRAGCWAEIASWYQPLPLPKSSPGRALAPEEERRLFRVASRNSRWRVAYCCALISANTTAGPGEIRKLQLQDVSLVDGHIYIRNGAKNKHRERSIWLNEDALWAVTQLLERAKKMGACEPQHYLLPHRARAQGAEPDATRPMGSWKKAWYRMRTAAGLPGLRPYDLRHHAITRLLENPEVSERTVIEIAGHVSKKMLERYSHIRAKARREAIDALNGKHAPASARRLRLVARKDTG